MFKSLSMWMWELRPASEQAKNDTEIFERTLRDVNRAKDLFNAHPPVNPGTGQIRVSGLLPVDDLIVEQSLGYGDAANIYNRFLPLTQVIRERVIDKGAVKFEVAERVKHIFTMEGRRCGKKEVQSITDEVIESMLKDAPIREKRVFGIVTSMGKILVGATGKAAEDYISYIKSLFGEGHICVWPVTVHSWNPNLVFDDNGGDGDFLLITDFARKLIHDAINGFDECPFMSAGSFQFSSAKEKFAVANASDSTVTDLLERIDSSYLDHIELVHEHVIFKLGADLTLKSIKLNDLEYTPENDEEVGLSAAYYRFYMNFFLGLFDSIVREVAKVNQEDADDV